MRIEEMIDEANKFSEKIDNGDELNVFILIIMKKMFKARKINNTLLVELQKMYPQIQ